jgi:PAS domain S-box-containing protein
LAPIKLAGKLLGFIIAERASGLGRWKGDEELFMMGVANACAGVLWHQLRHRAASVLVDGTASSKARTRNGNGNSNSSIKNGRAYRMHGKNEGPTIYWEIDRAGCIKSIDGDVESLYGRTRDQLIGQPVTFLSDSAQGQRDMDRLAALLSGQRCTGYETIHQATDGGAIHVTLRAKIWRDAGDRIIGARGTLQPVSAAVAT